MTGTVRRTQINKFVDIILDPAFAEDGVGQKSGTDIADGQAVGFGYLEKMIGGLSSSATRHVFAEDRWIPRDVFLYERDNSFDSHIAGVAGVAALNNGDGLALIEWRLRPS